MLGIHRPDSHGDPLVLRGSEGSDLELRVAELLIGPGGLAERLGYAYGPVRGPWLLRALLMRRARRLKSAPWSAVVRIGHRRVEVSVAAGDLTHPRDRGSR